MAIQISTNPGRRSSIDEIDLRASRLVTTTLKMDRAQDWYWSCQSNGCFFFMSLWNSSAYRRRLHLHRLPRYTEELYNPTILTSHIAGQDHPTARLLCCKIGYSDLYESIIGIIAHQQQTPNGPAKHWGSWRIHLSRHSYLIKSTHWCSALIRSPRMPEQVHLTTRSKLHQIFKTKNAFPS